MDSPDMVMLAWCMSADILSTSAKSAASLMLMSASDDRVSPQFVLNVMAPLLAAVDRKAGYADAVLDAVGHYSFNFEAADYVIGLAGDNVACLMGLCIQLHPHSVSGYINAIGRVNAQLPRIWVEQELAVMKQAPPARQQRCTMVRVPDAGAAARLSCYVPKELKVATLTKDTVHAPYVHATRRTFPTLRGVSMCNSNSNSTFIKTFPCVRDVLGDGLIAAGGAPLRSLTGAKADDIDIFWHGARHDNVVDEATERIVSAIRTVMLNLQQGCFGRDKVFLTKTNGVVTVGMFSEEAVLFTNRVQFILRMYERAEHVPLSFDLPPTQVTFDGTDYMVSEAALFAIEHRVTIPNPLRCTTMKRFLKYSSKGFEMCLPIPVDDSKFVSTVQNLSDGDVVSRDASLAILKDTSRSIVERVVSHAQLNRLREPPLAEEGAYPMGFEDELWDLMWDNIRADTDDIVSSPTLPTLPVNVPSQNGFLYDALDASLISMIRDDLAASMANPMARMVGEASSSFRYL